jgi:hypothetical protein
VTVTHTATSRGGTSFGVRATWFWDIPEFRRAMGLILVVGLSSFLLLPLLTLLLWAFADEWRYPNIIPQSFSLKWWEWVFTNGDVGQAVRYSFMTARRLPLACPRTSRLLLASRWSSACDLRTSSSSRGATAYPRDSKATSISAITAA